MDNRHTPEPSSIAPAPSPQPIFSPASRPSVPPAPTAPPHELTVADNLNTNNWGATTSQAIPLPPDEVPDLNTEQFGQIITISGTPAERFARAASPQIPSATPEASPVTPEAPLTTPNRPSSSNFYNTPNTIGANNTPNTPNSFSTPPDPSIIRTTGDHLSSAAIATVNSLIDQVNQTGNLSDFYDSARNLTSANLANSYQRNLE